MRVCSGPICRIVWRIPAAFPLLALSTQMPLCVATRPPTFLWGLWGLWGRITCHVHHIT